MKKLFNKNKSATFVLNSATVGRTGYCGRHFSLLLDLSCCLQSPVTARWIEIMAAKRISQSAVNWAAMAEKISETQRPMFNSFKAKSDGYLRKYTRSLFALFNNDSYWKRIVIAYQSSLQPREATSDRLGYLPAEGCRSRPGRILQETVRGSPGPLPSW